MATVQSKAESQRQHAFQQNADDGLGSHVSRQANLENGGGSRMNFRRPLETVKKAYTNQSLFAANQYGICESSIGLTLPL